MPNREPHSATTAPACLALGRRSPDHDKIDRAARPGVIENADHQPSGPPRKGVQISAAFVQQRTVGIIIVAMNDVEIAVALRESLRIALPQQRRFALPIQRNSGIYASVNVKA